MSGTCARIEASSWRSAESACESEAGSGNGGGRRVGLVAIRVGGARSQRARRKAHDEGGWWWRDRRQVDLLLAPGNQVARINAFGAEQELALCDGARPGDDGRRPRRPALLTPAARRRRARQTEPVRPAAAAREPLRLLAAALDRREGALDRRTLAAHDSPVEPCLLVEPTAVAAGGRVARLASEAVAALAAPPSAAMTPTTAAVA
jgi:hypothetical protein